MYITKRILQILSLISKSDGYIPLDIIENHVSISRRTLYNDLAIINECLSQNNLDELSTVRNKGISISERDRENIDELLNILKHNMDNYILSPEERKWFYVFLIITDKRCLTLELIADILNVSKTTILNDFVTLRLLCKTYEISLNNDNNKGYYFTGDEKIIRIVFLHSIMELRKIIKIPSFKDLFISEKSKFYEDLLWEMNKRFQPNSFNEIIDVLSIFFYRIEEREYVIFSKELLDFIMEQPEFRFIYERLNNKNNNFVGYIAFHLINDNKLSKLSNENDDSNTKQEVRSIVSSMVSDLELISMTNFKNRAKLIKGLTAHIMSSKFRYENGLIITNPFLNEVKNKYNYIYNLVKVVSHHLENYFHRCLIADEIAFITLHFALHFTEIDSKKDDPIKILVMCPNGVTTSSLLKKEVELLIDTASIIQCSTVDEFNEYGHIDLILTTIPIEAQLSCPVLHVHPILSEYDKIRIFQHINSFNKVVSNNTIDEIVSIINSSNIDEKVKKDLTKEIINVSSNALSYNIYSSQKIDIKLGGLVDISNIQVCDCANNWKEAIRLSANPLLDKRLISKSYIEAMLNNIERYGPYIIIHPGVALAHAREEDGVLDFGISILKLNKEVNFQNDKTAFLIFTIASSKDNYMNILTKLIKLFENKKSMINLRKADTPKKIYNIISKF
ncbi:BglG family transcription antiterminator [Paratissierella segnis]|jgi:transcriptional antiterminator/mannitol/fructose-specific phosphotransferase system IIA component|uniref:BglG family transcription antiterminator n=1 Tax=Paratissierella segnis TaxID=2763679 RepID=A0A926IIS1_9FIRM|nr:PTS sugar transporter subunit IIA [Paratissierella segnis]MBC8586651.1 BglG family transcription antiterminator [Paratissierella segnis]